MTTGRIVVFLVGAFTALTLRADTVNLGASTQNWVQTGLGQFLIGGIEVGGWDIQQGSCSTSAGTVTCDLSGSIFGGGSPGFTSGTYSLITTFAATDVPSIQGISVGPDPGPDPGDNTFTYYYLAPDVSMVLDLDTPGGDYAVPLVTAGAFDGPDFSFGYTGTEGCTGVVTCEPGAVALAPGATISGPVDGSAEFSNAAAVPEPSSLVLLSTLVLAVALIARKSWAHRPATRTSG
jgi:hypothetical protein